eukprot:2806418-Pyramimonas_sp.AAC.1
MAAHRVHNIDGTTLIAQRSLHKSYCTETQFAGTALGLKPPQILGYLEAWYSGAAAVVVLDAVRQPISAVAAGG